MPLRKRLLWLWAATALMATACGGSALPTTPSSNASVGTASSAPVVNYAVQGTVQDTAGRPIAEATLQVTTGPSAGAVAVSDTSGRFRFEAVAGLAMIRASKPGYLDLIKQLYLYPTIGEGRATIYFHLPSANRPPLSLSGTYQLTFRADPACVSLPDHLRTRTYTTPLSGTGAWQLIYLSGAVFAPPANGYPGPNLSWNVISMSVFEDFASLYFEDPSIQELLDNGSALNIYGHASGTITQPRTELAVAGSFWAGAESCRADRLTIERVG